MYFITRRVHKQVGMMYSYKCYGINSSLLHDFKIYILSLRLIFCFIILIYCFNSKQVVIPKYILINLKNGITEMHVYASVIMTIKVNTWSNIKTNNLLTA